MAKKANKSLRQTLDEKLNFPIILLIVVLWFFGSLFIMRTVMDTNDENGAGQTANVEILESEFESVPKTELDTTEQGNPETDI